MCALWVGLVPLVRIFPYVDRSEELFQLPSRYYDGSVTPPSPPLGTFTVPKLPPAVTPQLQSTVTSGKITQDEGLEIEQKKSAVQVCHQSQPSNATNACATNVNVPPPNYCLPPPNCQQNQETVPPKGSIIPVSSTKCEKVAAEDIEKSVHQRNGHGDGGCGDRTQNANKYDDRYGNLMNKNPPSYQGYPAMRSSDVRLCGGRESLNDRSKMENGDMYLRSEEAEWQGTQYAVTDRDLENRRWRSGGDGGQSVGPVPLMSVNTSQIGLAYNREREEEAGRRQNVEREAAIERSRQKRRIVNQGMMTQECESGDQPQYGSLRDNDTFSEVDRPASTCSFGQTSQESACVMIRQEQAQQKWNMDGSGQVENYVDCGSSRHDGRFEQLDRILQQHQQSEYRMLRRPDSKDSAEINLQISNMSIHGEEEDELQLTKLSLPVPKVIKRVAPAPLSLQAAGPGSDQSTGIQDGGHAQRGYQLDRNQEKRNNQQRMHQREKRAQRNHADMNSLQNSNSNL
ncbi:hypothetical protein AB6A40_010377 [Gnathostoma spinigerum]|uniref:Uncharacterized protein n=1 Tax=Gnathostoma spinigerum TaxID=75299 RepID=A0ABD6F1L9_9BILA